MKFCARCNKPLKDWYDEIDNPAATGGGATIYVCKSWCKPAPTQSAPVSRR